MTVAEPPVRPTVEIEPLLTYEPSGPTRGGNLPPTLRDSYGSDLWIPLRTDRPTVIANFVSTIDGVVSFNTPGAAGGGEISGFFKPDRFVMGLLRSVSDAVLIGAGTLRAAPTHTWSPAHVFPPTATDFQALREQLRLSAQPTTFVVTASGDVDLSHPGLANTAVPVTIVTTDKGQAALRRQAPVASHVDVASTDSDRVDPSSLIEILRDRGMNLVLTEGGPHLFGQLVGAHVIDELFLTIAPQMAGRSSETRRLSLVEGAAFARGEAPWSQLVDLRKSGSHLFARYRLQEAT